MTIYPEATYEHHFFLESIVEDEVMNGTRGMFWEGCFAYDTEGETPI